MAEIVPILKDEENELPIPTLWRKTFSDIIEAFKDGDFHLRRGVAGVCPISEKEAARFAGNILAYGDKLVSLPEETWRTSLYRWMRGYWDVLIDLYTAREGASDLVLFVRVHEDGDRFLFEIQSVNVP
jgi:hypothetical protein